MEWKEVRLGDVVEIVNGFAFKSKAFTLEGIPVIKIKNIKAGKVILNDLDYISTSDINPKYTKIRSSDILITMTGNRMDGSPETWVGKVSLFRHQGDFYLNQRVSALRLIDDTVDNNFLSYYLSSWQSQLYFALNSNSSGGQANITPAVVQEYRLMVPELETQRSIASILSSLDRKIELNNKINADLEEMAQAIFKNWFVDFEPFKDGRFVDSELGMIPEGWKVGSLGDMGTIVCGKTPSKANSNYYGGDIPFIKIPDMHGKVFVESSEDRLTEQGSLSQIKKLIPPYSLMVSCIATVGLVSINTKPSHTNQQINTIIPHNKSALFYLYQYIKNNEELLKNMGRGGTTTLNVNTKSFCNIRLFIPSDIALLQFHQIVEGLFKKIELNMQESRTLSLLRDTLLPRLMSGELEIPE